MRNAFSVEFHYIEIKVLFINEKDQVFIFYIMNQKLEKLLN